ncbi:hypothetical protein CIL05_14475 [Virgibacillus profundi]|uniref:Uncharacterized protein n=1 Tax=Virgibacillus profundi TaxID=2024555 RepID=A0A2A2IBS3_9BACI|nr:hypothetical protein [Virgibacillus profundi]PAV28828.1 hypothetical protein CIL05_14475 [Virgibacillus profundi]PXY52996.1 hypothetical protein CIT14_14600 [Virgibacillus profundi]
MTKVTISPRKSLADGTLMWIYANNKKVYYSSKGHEVNEFNEHDSNYLGEVGKVCKNQQLSVVADLLKKKDRIYGICMNEDNNQNAKDVDVLFFSTWDKLLNYAETYSNETEKIVQRKKEEKQKWLEQGRRYLKNKEQEKEI